MNAAKSSARCNRGRSPTWQAWQWLAAWTGKYRTPINYSSGSKESRTGSCALDLAPRCGRPRMATRPVITLRMFDVTKV
jgi:hypothetical protein